MLEKNRKTVLTNFTSSVLAALLITVPPVISATPRDKALLDSAHKHEQEVDLAAKHELSNYLEIFGKLLNTEKTLMTLKVDGKEYPASSGYIAEKVKRIYDCSYVVMDDTIHTTEGDFVAIPWHHGSKFSAHSVWPVKQIESVAFFTGDPGEMHQNGYKNVRKIAYDLSTERLDYRPSYNSGHQLLFAILKVKGDKFYRKFVFVIDPPTS